MTGAGRPCAARPGARLAPFGAAVMLLAIMAALLAPLVAPYDPLKQNLGNALARPEPRRTCWAPTTWAATCSRG